MLSAHSSEHFKEDAFELWKLLFKEHFILDVKQYSNYKSLIAKTSDRNTLKMKAVSAISVIKNKE